MAQENDPSNSWIDIHKRLQAHQSNKPINRIMIQPVDDVVSPLA